MKYRYRLREPDVIEIIKDHTTPIPELAARYDVTVDTIHCVYGGRRWKHITQDPQYPKRPKGHVRKIPEEVVRSIKNLEDVDFDTLAKQYDVSVKYLKQLRNPNRIDVWKHIYVKGYEDPNKIKKRTTLNKEQVTAIYRDRTSSNRHLGFKYKVNPRTISAIRHGTRHKALIAKLKLEDSHA